MPPRKKLPRKQVSLTGYWHGGPAGLAVGDVILPASELSHMPGFYAMEDYADADPNRVYVTTSPLIAESFAELVIDWSRMPPVKVHGAVYEVEPVGSVEPDPDYPGSGCHFSCERARIVAVTKPRIWTASRDARLASMPHMTWDDGAPTYDARGYGLPSGAAQLLGVRPEDLRGLGFGPTIEEINMRSSQVLMELGVTQEQVNAARESLKAGLTHEGESRTS